MRLFAWRSRKRESEAERIELEQAKKRVADLSRRKEKLEKDNHFVMDIKKVLGAG